MLNLSFATKVVEGMVYRGAQVSPACITYLRPDIHHTAEVTQLRQRCSACMSYELLTEAGLRPGLRPASDQVCDQDSLMEFGLKRYDMACREVASTVA